MPRSNRETITDEQRDTFVAHDEFEDRFFALMQDSKQVGKIIENTVKDSLEVRRMVSEEVIETLKKRWPFIFLFVLTSVLSISKVAEVAFSFLS